MRRRSRARFLPSPPDLLESLNARCASTSADELGMAAPHVQFLTFDGCPLADVARSELKIALKECGIENYEEIDILDPSASENLRGWGSPTILVNGVDVAGQRKGDDASCRFYGGDRRVLMAADIIKKIEAQRQ